MAALLVVLWAAVAAADVGARQNPLSRLFGRDRGVAYNVYRDPANRFQIDYPQKELRVLSSGGSSLAVFAHKDGAPTVYVDHVPAKEPYTAAELAEMPEMELERLRRQEPATKQFSPEALDSKSGRGVLIRYFRVGRGREWAVHYTIATGQGLFRVHALVPERLVTKYEPIVIHMIQSFRAPAEPVAVPSKP